jgi:hypothetical protein
VRWRKKACTWRTRPWIVSVGEFASHSFSAAQIRCGSVGMSANEGRPTSARSDAPSGPPGLRLLQRELGRIAGVDALHVHFPVDAEVALAERLGLQVVEVLAVDLAELAAVTWADNSCSLKVSSSTWLL